VLFFLTDCSINTHLYLLIETLIASLGCNLFITGLNQIIDRDLDKINKPDLPIPAGLLTVSQAKKIVGISLVIAIIFGVIASKVLLILITIISFLGVIYSVPPIQLKRHHITAAWAITTVRGFLVNIGMAFHFSYSKEGNFNIIKCLISEDVCHLPIQAIWPLTIFIIAFSISIAWYKDLHDIEGDKQFGFNTMPLLYSPRFALKMGALVVLMAFIQSIYWFYAHHFYLQLAMFIILSILYIINLFNIKTEDKQSIKKFYKLFWLFFFGAYMVYGSLCF
jgi:homogentisate phytyltransferase/homogentisate geranylgeranyltransferase